MNDFDKLLDLNVLYRAFQKCKEGVYWKSSVQKFESNLLFNLYKLKKELQNGTYKQRPFDEFDICERGKQRHIKALHIRDRVLQRALCDEILMPKLGKYLIHDNGANVKRKGVDFAKRRLRDHLRRYFLKEKTNEGYILQLDIHKYFESIPQDKALESLSEHFKDDRIIWLLRVIMDSFGNNGIGVGIGSQVSQVIGTYYLNRLDNYIKVVKGVNYYARYSDDMYIIHRDKKFLRSVLYEMRCIIFSCGLSLNENKTQIRKLGRRFVFLKIRYKLTERGAIVLIPCRETFKRERRKIKMFAQSSFTLSDFRNQYLSWRGNVTYSKCVGLRYKSYRNVSRMDLLTASTLYLNTI